MDEGEIEGKPEGDAEPETESFNIALFCQLLVANSGGLVQLSLQ